MITVVHYTKIEVFPLRIFISKCDQIRSFLRIWSHLSKKSLMDDLVFLCSGNSKYRVVIVTKLNENTDIETMEITSTSEICQTIYYNCSSSFFLNLERRNDKVLRFHTNNSSYFEIRAYLLQAPCSKWGKGEGGVLLK